MTILFAIAICLIIVLIFLVGVAFSFMLGKHIGETNKRFTAHNQANLTKEEIAEKQRKIEINKRQLENFYKYDGTKQS